MLHSNIGLEFFVKYNHGIAHFFKGKQSSLIYKIHDKNIGSYISHLLGL